MNSAVINTLLPKSVNLSNKIFTIKIEVVKSSYSPNLCAESMQQKGKKKWQILNHLKKEFW